MLLLSDGMNQILAQISKPGLCSEQYVSSDYNLTLQLNLKIKGNNQVKEHREAETRVQGHPWIDSEACMLYRRPCAAHTEKEA